MKSEIVWVLDGSNQEKGRINETLNATDDYLRESALWGYKPIMTEVASCTKL